MRLVIYAGQLFSADFTVVSGDGVTGETLLPGDTGTFSVIKSGLDAECVIGPVSMTIIEYDNGLFNVELSIEQTSLLTTVLGGEEDQFSSISNYNGYLNFTLEAGDRQATVPIYVEEVPTCPTPAP